MKKKVKVVLVLSLIATSLAFSLVGCTKTNTSLNGKSYAKAYKHGESINYGKRQKSNGLGYINKGGVI